MTTESPMLVRSFRVGPWTCTMTVPRIARGAVKLVTLEWDPHIPRRLTAQELRQYRAGRDAALEELAGEIVGVIAVVET